MSDDPAQRDSELERLFRHIAIGQLGAGIVHEVRNLVTSIRGFAQIAARRVDDPDQVRELLEGIELKSGHCVETLSRFLELSSAGATGFDRLNVNDAVRGAQALLEHHMQLHRIALNVSVADTLPPVLGDRLLVQQVLVNLLLNAQQAQDGPGVVSMTSRHAGDHVEVVVEDDGPGIAPELCASIFETGVTTKPDGCGYGLALCRDIMRRHNGTISAESADGGGARFTVRLPVAEARDG